MEDKVIATGKLFAKLKDGGVVYWDVNKLKVFIPREVEDILEIRCHILCDYLTKFKEETVSLNLIMSLIVSNFIHYDEYSEEDPDMVIANNNGYEC